MLAASQDFMEMVVLLVQLGADISIENKNGETALILAEEYYGMEAAEYLRSLNYSAP